MICPVHASQVVHSNQNLIKFCLQDTSHALVMRVVLEETIVTTQSFGDLLKFAGTACLSLLVAQAFHV